MLNHPATPTTPAGGTLDAGGPTSQSFTAGPPATGAATGPGDCLGPNCSDYDLLVQNPGGLAVKVRLDWTLIANDYDLYVYQQPGDVLVASSGNGATTFEETTFTPQANTTYQILIVHFATTADQVQGVASLISPGVVTQPTRTGPGGTGIVFSPNGNVQTPGGEAPTGRGTVFAKETVRDGEPSVRADVRGNVYPAGIRGVPAGVDVWRFGPQAYCPRFEFHEPLEFPTGDPSDGYVWLKQPDNIFPNKLEGSPDAGGGDIELAVSVPALSTATPVLSMVSLTLANITAANSVNRGNVWSPANPVAATVPLDDRQWIDAYGTNTVYLYYRTLATLTGLILNKSIDGGLTYAAATTIVNPLGLTPGWISVGREPNPDGSVNIYLSGQNSSELRVFRCVDPTPTLPNVVPITCTSSVVDNTMSHGHIFDPVVVGRNGDVYAAWSNNKDIFYAYSTDKGATWSAPVQVTSAGQGGMPAFNFFPWITAGTNGRIGIVWYGTTNGATTNADNNAEWKAFYAFSSNAKATTPALRWLPASDHVLHKHNVSQAGLSTEEANNRNLIDFFQVAFDPRDGAAVIAFADDHNDFDGATYYTRQLAGPGLVAGKTPTQRPCPPLAPFRVPEVRDFLGDQTVSADITFPVPDLDIINMDYSSKIEGNKLLLQAEFRLASIPLGQRSYRGYFSVNTQRGLLDVGNEYFIELVTGLTGQPAQYWLGVTDRNPDGTTAERRVEQIPTDQQANPIKPGVPARIVLQVDVQRLDWLFVADSDPNTAGFQPQATNGGSTPPAPGSLVIGLRGRTRLVLPTGGLLLVDETRGGSYRLLRTFSGPTANVVDTESAAVSTFGGWHLAETPTGTEYFRHVASGATGAQRPTLELQFAGRTTSVRYDYFTSGRGGIVEVFVDGQSRGTINQYRASSDPTGSLNLVRASKTFTVPARQQPHTFRVDARTDLTSAPKNIAYVEKVTAQGGAQGKPAIVDEPTQFSHVLAPGATIDHVLVADPLTLLLTAMVEPADPAVFRASPLKLQLLSPTGAVLTTLTGAAAKPLTLAAPAAGEYVLRVANTGKRAVAYKAALVKSQRQF
ncbi:MAG: hypothetical protein ABR599_06115 [Gemmatimonadota bacterium]